ncbi:hypothetical protein C8R28_104622 [Nitrosomonas ureae]|uniref:Uncharacterized protein n=2 Tax=Nitrosomonas ureae TaxID=44577 RepID=A0A2T5I7C5_9PROT|nr:hypothetical protein C8R28_104622 [Nitrosomonas ureae]
MKKQTFTLTVETQLKQAYALGFRYLVTVYKNCPLGEKRTFISYHYKIDEAKRAIQTSPYSAFLDFHDLTMLLKKPEYFFIT